MFSVLHISHEYTIFSQHAALPHFEIETMAGIGAITKVQFRQHAMFVFARHTACVGSCIRLVCCVPSQITAQFVHFDIMGLCVLCETSSVAVCLRPEAHISPLDRRISPPAPLISTSVVEQTSLFRQELPKNIIMIYCGF